MQTRSPEIVPHSTFLLQGAVSLESWTWSLPEGLLRRRDRVEDRNKIRLRKEGNGRPQDEAHERLERDQHISCSRSPPASAPLTHYPSKKPPEPPPPRSDQSGGFFASRNVVIVYRPHHLSPPSFPQIHVITSLPLLSKLFLFFRFRGPHSVASYVPRCSIPSDGRSCSFC